MGYMRICMVWASVCLYGRCCLWECVVCGVILFLHGCWVVDGKRRVFLGLAWQFIRYFRWFIRRCRVCFGCCARAIHVYKKLGFEIEGVQVGAVQISEGEFIDLVMMARVV